MATETKLICDVTGETEEVNNFTFTDLEGNKYKIDLSVYGVEKFNDALAPFIEKAQKQVAKTSGASSGLSNDIRTWAKGKGKALLEEKGLSVADRGQIPGPVVDLYVNSPK